MEDAFVIKMPKFSPQYKKWKKYGYRNPAEKKNLQNVLLNSTNGYCMYCFSRVKTDGKLNAHLEHAIEKNNSDKLIECIPDIGLTCMTCNQIFKKQGEKKRKLPDSVVKQYNNESKCSLEKRKQCTIPCKTLRSLQKKYNDLPEGKIILQPMGVKGSETGEELELQYDIINMEFQPAQSFHTYSFGELQFIDMHIKRFHLNDPKYKTHQLFDFIKNIIDGYGKIPQYEYNNLIVELFFQQIKDKPKEDILKLCKSIFCAMYLKI